MHKPHKHQRFIINNHLPGDSERLDGVEEYAELFTKSAKRLRRIERHEQRKRERKALREVWDE